MNTPLFTALQNYLGSTYQPDEYPTLGHQLQTWSVSRPLQGMRILDATPVFRNTLVKYLPLIAAGAELSIGIFDAIPCDPQIVQLLRSNGVEVVDAGNGPTGEYDLVLDCAGAFAQTTASIGYVELTRSGIPRYEGCPKPVYVADSGRIKRIETMLGTGESYFRAMRQRGYTEWEGRKIVVFGSGKVGSGILFYALREKASVTVVTDPQTLSPELAERMTAVIPLNDAVGAAQAVREAYAVVTATGVPHAVTRCGAAQAATETQAVLANMGVEDEYGPQVPEERVLSDKHPLNFELEEPTHLKYIDATMALHNAGAEYLVLHPESRGLLTPDPATEEELLRISCEKGAAGDEIANLLR